MIKRDWLPFKNVGPSLTYINSGGSHAYSSPKLIMLSSI